MRFTSRTGKKLALYALADPALSNTGDDDSGTATGHALVAHDASAGEALDRHAALHAHLESATSARATAGATCARTSAWTDAYTSAPNGNVVQTGRTTLDGVKHKRH